MLNRREDEGNGQPRDRERDPPHKSSRLERRTSLLQNVAGVSPCKLMLLLPCEDPPDIGCPALMQNYRISTICESIRSVRCTTKTSWSCGWWLVHLEILTGGTGYAQGDYGAGPSLFYLELVHAVHNAQVPMVG